jgi:beta-glucanase (GH16 family)
VFADDFSGPAGSLPNQKYWIMTSGRDYGIATDVASGSNVHLSGNGALEIEAIHQGGRWTSGEVQSKEAFEPGLGQDLIVTAHLKLPSGGQGYWPAFWAVGLPFRTNPNSEPTAGEIDIAETINDDKWLAQVLHCGPRKGGPCKENESRANGIGHIRMLSRPSGSIGWNTYGWEWVNRRVDPYIELTMNGVVELKVSRNMIGAVVWHAAFDHPWYLVVDLAIGGGWPGPPSPSSASEGSISISRLSVYKS